MSLLPNLSHLKLEDAHVTAFSVASVGAVDKELFEPDEERYDEEEPTYEEKMEQLFNNLLEKWVGGGLFFTPYEKVPSATPVDLGFADYLERTMSLRDLSDERSGMLKRLHALAWDYFLLYRLARNPLQGGLKLLGRGTYNNFYFIIPPDRLSHMEEKWIIISDLLRIIGYNPQPKHLDEALPCGIGVRVQRLPIKITDDRNKLLPGKTAYNTFFHSQRIIYDRDDQLRAAFSELFIGEVLSERDLAPPLLGSVLLQNDIVKGIREEENYRHFGYNVVSFYANAQRNLAHQFNAINALAASSKEWRTNPKTIEWLKKLGENILSLITRVSTLGMLLVDIKPENMLYYDTNRKDGPVFKDPTTEMIDEEPKVWMTDFDVRDTAFFPSVSEKDQKCIEIVHILMFLSHVQCHSTKVFNDTSDNDSPVGYHVVQPLRDHLLKIAPSSGGLGGIMSSSEGEDATLFDAMLKVRQQPRSYEEPSRPLWNGSFSPLKTNQKTTIAQRVALRVKDNADAAPEKIMSQQCFPYNAHKSLLKQMFDTLSRWSPPAYAYGQEKK